MIRVIGVQKFLAMVLCAVLFATLAGYWFYVLTPEIKEKKRRLALNTAEVNQMREDLNVLTQGLEQFKKQKTVFEKIQKRGFFDPQNRPETRQRINAMQKESRLLSARFSIDSAKTEVNEKATEAGYKILNTSIDFTLDAIEDTDIYNFIYLLNYGFPGQITIKRMVISRNIEVTEAVVRQINSPNPQPLVTAVVQLEWRTMVPDASLAINIDKEGEE